MAPQTPLRSEAAPGTRAAPRLLRFSLHAPTQAQALVYSLFPDFFPLTTGEAGTLFLTGITLLTLARIGGPRGDW